jgi:DNA-binding response OmpR family regulator
VDVLVVEDEPTLREGLRDLLEAAGHRVVAVGDGLDAVDRGLAEPFDVVLLDLMLPRLPGIEVCRRLRTARPALPIVMLTARGAEDEKVAGLAAGADDYVTKPFGVRELLARLDAVVRRAGARPADEEVLDVDGCRIDLGRLVVQRDGVEVTLTPREAGVLRWLYRHRTRAVSRAELLERVWGAAADLQTRTVDMTVVKLRQKVERDPSDPRIVVTVTGVGYRWGPAS